MNLNELEKLNPEFLFFINNMPQYIKDNYFVKQYKVGEIITRKNEDLKYFGIIVYGATRVVNEFENGNIYMIEMNPAIDYIGEVTILANQKVTSVSIESTMKNIVFFVPRHLAEQWIFSNIEILKKLSQKVANKLYSSSSEKGKNLFYPSDFILIDYLLKRATRENISTYTNISLNETRIVLSEEIGMNIKTLNRTINKLKDDKILSLHKGKIHMDYDNYLNATKRYEFLKYD